MIWLIIVGLITIGIIIYLWKDNPCYDFWDVIGNIGWSIVMIIVGVISMGLTFLTTSGITTLCADVEYDKVSESKIIALNDNLTVQDSYYVMSGYVDGDLYYYYYVQEEDLGYITKKVPANDSFIQYTEDEPRIEKYESHFINDAAYFWGGACMKDFRYIIYCPKDTVTNEFTIELK